MSYPPRAARVPPRRPQQPHASRRAGVGPEGGRALAGGLRANTTLRSLDLSLNGLKDEGVNTLAEAVPRPAAPDAAATLYSL